MLVYAATAVAVLLGWAYLGAVVLAVPDAARATLGPGMNLTALGAGPSIPAFLLALCAPTTLATGLDAATVAVTLAMWVAMVFAMMLPSALPMFTTYSDIAARIGAPRAVRAAATAVGRNPVSWLIPCHRALRKSGELGGYHWGLPVKRAMLAWEAARDDA